MQRLLHSHSSNAEGNLAEDEDTGEGGSLLAVWSTL